MSASCAITRAARWVAVPVMLSAAVPALALNSPVVLDYLLGSEGYTIGSTANGQGFGSTVRIVRDVNGDGLADIVVGVPGSAAGGVDSGAAWIVFGRSGVLPASINVEDLNATTGVRIWGKGDMRLGAQFDSAGDFNGDGIGDLLFLQGDNFTASTPGAFVILGRNTWPPLIDLDTFTDGVIELTRTGGIGGDFEIRSRGHSSGGSGDFNGDGYSDVAFAVTESGGFPNACAVVYGHPGGGGVASINALTGFAGILLHGYSNGVAACAFLGDVNRDGFADVGVSSLLNATAEHGFQGVTSVHFGRAYTSFGRTMDDAKAPNGFRLTQNVYVGIGSENLVIALRKLGDVNRDGYADIGVEDSSAGWPNVVFGRESVPSDILPLESLEGTIGFNLSGASHIARAGDVDRDGIDDIVISEATSSTIAGTRGRILFGHAGAFAATIDTSSINDDAGVVNSVLNAGSPSVGSSIDGGLDTNGDGIADYVFGHPDTSQSYPGGKAYLALGERGRLRCVSTGAAIPDNNATGITRTMFLSATAPIETAEIFVNITHTWVGDLTAWITSPLGTTVQLVNRPGHDPAPPYPAPIAKCAADNMVVTLADSAATSVDLDCNRSDVDGAPAYSGSRYKPTSPLGALIGQSPTGTWSLRVADNTSQDAGTLNSWCAIVYSTPFAPLPTPSPDRLFSDGFEQ